MTDAPEAYTVEQIREAFRKHAHRDDWDVRCFYESTLIAALRGEYDDPNGRSTRRAGESDD